MVPAILIHLFRNLLIQRQDAYANQTYNQATGQERYQLVNKPLTDATIKKHLEGKITLATYPRQDGLTNWIVIDIDSLDRNDVSNVVEQLRSLGVQPLVEDNPGKRFRVWIFHPPLNVNTARRLVSDVAGAFEVYPRIEPSASASDPGRPFRLPLGVNRESGRWCLFLTEHFEPFKDQVIALKTVQRAPPELIRKILDSQRSIEI